MRHAFTYLAAMALVGSIAATSAKADDVNVNFGKYAPGTALSAVGGVSFSLSGGPGPTTAPMTDGRGLTNSTTAAYPTANILTFSFLDGLASNISFVFDNYGATFSGRGATIVSLFDAGHDLLASQNIAFSSGTAYSFTTTGVKSMEFNNGTDGTDSWIFAVQSLSATVSPAVAVPGPEAGTGLAALAMAGVGAMAYRRKRLAA